MKKMPAIITVMFFLILVSAVAQTAPVQRIHEIRRPLFSIPAIVEAGGAFTLELALAADEKLATAELEPVGDPNKRISLAFKLVSTEGGVGHFAATVPANTPEALYDLAVQFSSNWTDYQPHAVKVIKKFKTEFDFIQLTDIHFNIQDIPGKDMNRIRRRMLMDASRENAEFILFTGDLGLEPPTYDEDYVYGYEQFKELLRLPVFMVPGNHEMYYDKTEKGVIDGADYWAANYGPIYHSFDYGKVHFVGIGDYDDKAWSAPWRTRRSHDAMFFGTVLNAAISDAQWKWLQDDVKAAAARGQGCIAYAHIPIETLQGGRRIGVPPVKVAGPNTDQFVQLFTDNGCLHLFVGHNHVNLVKKFGALTEILTMAAGTGTVDGKWGYQIVHVKDGKVTGWKLHEIGFEDLK